MGGGENPRRGFAGGGGEESAAWRGRIWEDGQVGTGEASRRLSGVGFGCVAGSGEETGCYMGPARRIFVGETWDTKLIYEGEAGEHPRLSREKLLIRKGVQRSVEGT